MERAVSLGHDGSSMRTIAPLGKRARRDFARI
jgi:hypothetical protein